MQLLETRDLTIRADGIAAINVNEENNRVEIFYGAALQPFLWWDFPTIAKARAHHAELTRAWKFAMAWTSALKTTDH